MKYIVSIAFICLLSSCGTVINTSRFIDNTGKIYLVAYPTKRYVPQENHILIELEKFHVKDEITFGGEDIHMYNFKKTSQAETIHIERKSIPKGLSNIYPIDKSDVIYDLTFPSSEYKNYTLDNKHSDLPYRGLIIEEKKSFSHYLAQPLYYPAVIVDMTATVLVIPIGIIALPFKWITED